MMVIPASANKTFPLRRPHFPLPEEVHIGPRSCVILAYSLHNPPPFLSRTPFYWVLHRMTSGEDERAPLVATAEGSWDCAAVPVATWGCGEAAREGNAEGTASAPLLVGPHVTPKEAGEAISERIRAHYGNSSSRPGFAPYVPYASPVQLCLCWKRDEHVLFLENYFPNRRYIGFAFSVCPESTEAEKRAFYSAASRQEAMAAAETTKGQEARENATKRANAGYLSNFCAYVALTAASVTCLPLALLMPAAASAGASNCYQCTLDCCAGAAPPRDT